MPFVDFLARSLWHTHFRGKYRLLSALTPESGEFTCRRMDWELRLDLGDLIQRHIYLGTFEPEETGILRERLAPGQVFVDVGANVGWYSLNAARRVGPTGKVFSFEPGPQAYRRLKETIDRNRIANLQLVHCALGAQAGTADIFEPDSPGNYTPTMVEGGSHRRVPVEVQTLDAAADRLKIDHIDILKIDVEGFELNVMKGASGMLAAGRIRAVICEFNEPWLSRAGGSVGELYQLFMKHGFREIDGSVRPPTEPLSNRFLCLTGKAT